LALAGVTALVVLLLETWLAAGSPATGDGAGLINAASHPLNIVERRRV